MKALWAAAGILVTAPNEWDKNAIDVRSEADTHYVDFAEPLRVGDPAEELGSMSPISFNLVDVSTQERSKTMQHSSSTSTLRSSFTPYSGTPTVMRMEDLIAEAAPAAAPQTDAPTTLFPSRAMAGSMPLEEPFSPRPADSTQTRERLIALRRLCSETLGGESPFLETALATYIANIRLDGSVVWLLMVAPPSSGKTLVIHLLSGLPNTLEADDISFGGLLSNTRKEDKSVIATGGLLREVDALGGKAVILGSDLTEYLNEYTDKRSTMGALRLVHDGRWHRAHGSEGGGRNGWSGRVGFIGGVTGVVDQSFAIRNSMGERFLYLRSSQTLRESFRRAMYAGMMSESERESRIGAGVKTLLDTVAENPVAPTPGSVSLRVTSLATVIGMLRTTVPRGSHFGAAIAAPEGPSRLSQQLTSLYRGFSAIGCTAAEAWASMLKVARDTVQPFRFRVFEQLLVEPGESVPTPRIARALGKKTEDPTINRILHSFAALGLVKEVDPRETRNSWVLMPEVLEICRYAFTEDLPEPSPEEFAAIMGCDEPAPVLQEASAAEATAAPLVGEDDIAPPEDDGGGGGGGDLPLRQPPLITAAPDRDQDVEPETSFAFDDRQPV